MMFVSSYSFASASEVIVVDFWDLLSNVLMVCCVSQL